MADTWPKHPPHLIITLDRHAGLFLVWPIVVPGVAWHLGFAQEGWSKTMGDNKWNDDVLADGMPICSKGNKPEHCLVPHWNLFSFPPWNPNLLIPLLILMSSSNNFIAVGSVVAKKGPIAVSLPFVKVIGTNLACNDPVPMPTDIVIVPSSTVILGFTLGDLVAALLSWAIEALIAYVMSKLTKAFGRIAKNWAGKLGTKLTQRFSGGLGNWVGTKLLGFAGKLPPGAMKRAALDWMGRVGMNKTFQAGAPDAADRLINKGLNRLLGENLPTRPFQSVFDAVYGSATKAGLGYVQEATGIPTSAGGAFKALKNQAFPPGPYTPSVADKVGAFIDGRSEMLPPPGGQP
ncbi:MAG: hypothetical protein U0271_36665 [Polyangiaceae bacterium]